MCSIGGTLEMRRSSKYNLLEIKDLSVSFGHGTQSTKVVRNLYLTVGKGEFIGMVGESGSGKSVTARTVAGLIHYSGAARISGEIWLNGRKQINHRNSEQIRQSRISMIFQDPLDSLNPSLTVGYQIDEVFMARQGMARKPAREKTLDLLQKVRIPLPHRVAGQYPHQLSGGMCQRIMIAIALAADPDLLIADEPTTALDVTIQARILQLLYGLYQPTQKSILFITHDLGVIARFCHSVAVILDGEIVEKGSVRDVFNNPLHPYTRGLIDSIPVLGNKKRLVPMPSNVDIKRPKNGCGYYHRCPNKSDPCHRYLPELLEYETGHYVRCLKKGCASRHE